MAPPLGELSAKLTERVVLRVSAFVVSECLLQQIAHLRCGLFLYFICGVGVDLLRRWLCVLPYDQTSFGFGSTYNTVILAK